MRTFSKLKLFLLSTLLLLLGVIAFDIVISVNNWISSKFVVVEEKVIPVVKKINPEQLRCMANNIYFEAGGEPFMGKVAVARVVMNRIEHGFGTTPCKVINQYSSVKDSDGIAELKKICQFSWVCEGKGMPNKMSVAYRQSEEIARQVLSEDRWAELIPDNILFFHNNMVNPRWAYRKAFMIGNHIFYSKGNERNKNDEKKI
jgi:spore germination cell wall hydrolase CwlJ-like protein